jgi:hypothetical protein
MRSLIKLLLIPLMLALAPSLPGAGRAAAAAPPSPGSAARAHGRTAGRKKRHSRGTAHRGKAKPKKSKPSVAPTGEL